MSRYYHLHVQIRGVTDTQLEETMSNFGWGVIDRSFIDEDVLQCNFEGNLCGGQLEEQAHNEIAAAFRVLRYFNNKCIT